MTINVGDKIPTVDLTIMTTDGPEGISTDDIFSGKKVAIFGVPGAFTPTCSAKHHAARRAGRRGAAGTPQPGIGPGRDGEGGQGQKNRLIFMVKLIMS